MSISSELLTLQNTKTAIRTAINNKGGSVGASDTFASYATAIDNLPSGGSGNPVLTSIDVSDFTDTTFNRATSYITDVTIPSGVTSIGNYAFSNCSSLTSINIPSSVTSIGQNAFSSCTGLTGNMDIKGTSYGERAFMNCTGLTSLTVTESNAIFAYAVFDGCTSVTSVNVDSLETWLNLTFTNVQNLPYGNPLSLQQKPALNVNGTVLSGELSIPNTVTSIKNGAFTGYDRITSLVMSNTVTSIASYAFINCTGLANVTVGSGVTSIGAYVFNRCTSLASVDIPDSVATIGQYAFSDTNSPVKVTIGSGITRIETGAFQNVTANGSVTIKKTTPPTLGGSYVFWGSYPIYVPSESVDTYKAASGWSSYASRIYPITQVATVDGNPVYNYDLGNKDATTILSTEMDKLPTGTSIEFAEGITNMSGSISGYTTVTLPSTFTTFNDQDMIGSSVTTLTMKSTTPTTAERNRFGGSGLTAIYVPASAVDTYKADSGWSSFASIIQAIPTE